VGVATESQAFFSLAPAPRTLGMPDSAARQRDAMAAKIRETWEEARSAFEDALEASPRMMEARLRLGHILWRLGRPEPARAALEAVLEDSGDTRLEYLAHLFLGRVLEDARKWTEAETHYRAALAMQPRSEIAAVAVSHVRFLQGDTETAREVLRAGMEGAKRRSDFDPWMPYVITQTPDGLPILDELRRGLRP
jgi:tetratricopeptide (TPR) repeat protein